MKRQSFRSIITISLIIVISIISFTAFKIYSDYLRKNIYRESGNHIISALSTLELLEDQFYCTIDEFNNRTIGTPLHQLDTEEQVLNSRLFNAQGELKYVLYKDVKEAVPISREELFALEEGISVQSFPSAEMPFSRAFIHLHNSARCYECHSPEQENLGYVVIDISMDKTEGNIAFIRRSSILFTLIMVVVIISFILFLHYRFVRKSLREFNLAIVSVNQGNLESRLSIPETKELGRLGKSFNSMLDTLQKAQNELQEYHKKELRSNYKMATIGEMSARLAHEIRNPITGIANAIEIIVNKTNDELNKPILEEIQRQAQRVNDAITSLLIYSRKRELDLNMNSINELIDQLVFFLQNQVQHKEIVFHLSLSEDVPHFRFDIKQMEDVLLNLGLNAIHAISKSGTITFKTSYNSVENKTFIHVIDTGTGIPEKDVSKIFHPFYTTRSEGTGLGLAIVKDVIDKHNGEIWVENNKAKGCTFTISLPAKL